MTTLVVGIFCKQRTATTEVVKQNDYETIVFLPFPAIPPGLPAPPPRRLSLRPPPALRSSPSATVTQMPQLTATSAPTATPTLTPTSTPAVLVGAGDIAICGQEGDDQTAALLDEIPGVIFTTGDNVNEDDTLYQFENCFGPSWGRHKDRIRPAAGNHEYKVDHAADYFSYFWRSGGQYPRRLVQLRCWGLAYCCA